MYLILKTIHVSSVITSGLLFSLRGVLMWRQSPWLEHRVLKILPHLVDTVLLLSAVALTLVLQQYPFVQAWLTVKVLLLAAYIVVGSYALKRGRSLRQRRLLFILALAIFLFIVSVARSHSPWGVFWYWH